MRKNLLILGLLITTLFCIKNSVYSQQAVNIDNKLNKSYSEIISNNLESAEKALEEVLKSDPNNINAHLYLGLIYHKKCVYDKALIEYFKVLQKDKNNLMLNYNLGLLYQEMNSYQKALEFYLNVIKIKPDFPDVYFNVARVYQELNTKDSKTINFYETYLKYKPEDLDALNNLAVTYKTEGNYDKASEIFAKIIDIDPTYTPARYNMALMYLINNNQKELEKEIKLLKKLSADHAKILDIQISKYNSNK